MSKNTSSSTSGCGCISFAGLLTILFVGLKLTHYIDWSWWWIISPITIYIMSLIVAWVFLVIILTIELTIEKLNK